MGAVRAAWGVLLLALLVGGCNQHGACLELALRECECCSEELVEDCKTGMELAAEERPADDLSEARCEESAKAYRGCVDTSLDTLRLICVPLES